MIETRATRMPVARDLLKASTIAITALTPNNGTPTTTANKIETASNPAIKWLEA